jgi:hypothetical protein
LLFLQTSVHCLCLLLGVLVVLDILLELHGCSLQTLPLLVNSILDVLTLLFKNLLILLAELIL